ncbi:hypothetical protein V493_04362 [Pseudogymnoascus sp. VKM F-4281 (FW-2241)]|nr:hypothetical protein V493_04362 [Pseudogymnoascus sp. VKM F-4281 (FW-2241)]
MLTSVRRVTKCKQNIAGYAILRDHGRRPVRFGALHTPKLQLPNYQVSPAPRDPLRITGLSQKGRFCKSNVPLPRVDPNHGPAGLNGPDSHTPLPVAMVSSICSSAAQQHGNHVASTLAPSGSCSISAAVRPIAVTALHLRNVSSMGEM